MERIEVKMTEGQIEKIQEAYLRMPNSGNFGLLAQPLVKDRKMIVLILTEQEFKLAEKNMRNFWHLISQLKKRDN